MRKLYAITSASKQRCYALMEGPGIIMYYLGFRISPPHKEQICGGQKDSQQLFPQGEEEQCL